MFQLFRQIIILSFLLIAGSFPSTVWGQTIHAILAADRADAKIGRGVAVDLENMTHLLRSNIPPTNLHLVILEVGSMTPEGLLEAVDSLTVHPDDAVLFYYSGHGAYDAANRKQFFALTKGGNIYRETLLTKIEEKSPRLAVLLSDCCNNEVNDASARSVTLPEPRILKTPGSFSPLFENLLVFCKGTVDLTSSKPGQFSFVDGKNPSRGSFFTWALAELLNRDRTNEDLDWVQFVEKLGVESQKAFHESYPKGILDRSGQPVQMGQTVYIHKVPGMSATLDSATASTPHLVSAPTRIEPAPAPTGPRLGLRAITHDGGGVRITEIASDAPAGKAGFFVGEIITEINGKAIRNETDYSDAIDQSQKIMEVKLKRADHSTRTLTVELGW